MPHEVQLRHPGSDIRAREVATVQEFNGPPESPVDGLGLGSLADKYCRLGTAVTKTGEADLAAHLQCQHQGLFTSLAEITIYATTHAAERRPLCTLDDGKACVKAGTPVRYLQKGDSGAYNLFFDLHDPELLSS